MAGGRRATQQMHNRKRILAAAREEFAQVGYREAKINSIAARADLTRGAIYSNFPSKRALGLTVAADRLPTKSTPSPTAANRDEAVMSLAQAWLNHVPMGDHGDAAQVEHLANDLYAEIREDQDLRDACAALLQLDAIILALVLERLEPDYSSNRAVRAASALLAVLHSTDRLAASAPGFIDPFTIVSTCKALASTDFADRWTPPHETIVPAIRALDRPWEPSKDAHDLVTDTPIDWGKDGVVAILGLRQAANIEQALRIVPDEHNVTLVLVTDDPAERMPLAQFVLSEILETLRQSVQPEALTVLSIALDHDGSIARAAGLRAATDDTHVALRINGHRIIEQADGPAACYAVSARLHEPTPG